MVKQHFILTTVRAFDGNGGLTFASINPIQADVFDQNLGPGDNNEIGHIEVIGVYGAAGVVNTPSGAVSVFRGMSKFELAKIFDANTRVTELVPLNGAETSAFTRDANGNPFPTPAGNIRSTDPTWVQLMGQVTMTAASNADRMGYRLPALAGEIDDNVPPEGSVTFANGTDVPFDGRVISNPNFDARGGNQAPETAVGFNFAAAAYGAPTFVYDNIMEIETALAATDVLNTYEDDGSATPVAGINRTQLIITFPTKYRHFNRDVCLTGLPSVPWSPPFEVDGSVPYSLSQFDNQENVISIGGSIFSGGPAEAIDVLLAEVNYFLPAWDGTQRDSAGNIIAGQLNFDTGWFNMSLQERVGCPYPGLPVLSMSHKYEVGSGAIDHSWLIPNSHKPEFNNYRFPAFGASNLPAGSP